MARSLRHSRCLCRSCRGPRPPPQTKRTPSACGACRPVRQTKHRPGRLPRLCARPLSGACPICTRPLCARCARRLCPRFPGVRPFRIASVPSAALCFRMFVRCVRYSRVRINFACVQRERVRRESRPVRRAPVVQPPPPSDAKPRASFRSAAPASVRAVQPPSDIQPRASFRSAAPATVRVARASSRPSVQPRAFPSVQPRTKRHLRKSPLSKVPPVHRGHVVCQKQISCDSGRILPVHPRCPPRL
jgi:hypothetical protein